MTKKSVVRVKENPKLGQRTISNGRISLFLEYYLGYDKVPVLDESGNQAYYPEGTPKAGQPITRIVHNRRKKELKLYLTEKPKTAEERERNKETLLLARKIRQDEEQALLNDTMGYRIDTYKSANFITFFETYISDYTKADIRNVRSALERFKTYLRIYRPACAVKRTTKETDAIKAEWDERHKGINGRHPLNENAFYRFNIKPAQITPELVRGFVEYLKANSTGEGANTTYARFKKVVHYAEEKGLLKSDPCSGITCTRSDTLTKAILSRDEIASLVSVHYPGENPEIRRAFILSLYTGIRFCDVKELRYSDIDYKNALLTFEQAKTTGHSKESKVYMPLRPEILALLGTPEEYDKSVNDRIFDLPSHTMCNKALGRWAKRAGIEKHLTWHCGRHSFATNVLEAGANVAVVAKLLGHSGLKYVEKYVRAIDESKRAAVESLPSFEL